MHYELLKEASKEDLVMFNTCMFNRLQEEHPKLYKELELELFLIVKEREIKNSR